MTELLLRLIQVFGIWLVIVSTFSVMGDPGSLAIIHGMSRWIAVALGWVA